MIFEKEDKYLNNEEKLKNEDKELAELEQEIKNMELKYKEKAQESNLLDFKLRQMVRNNDIDAGFLKPHPGIHAGVLSSQAGAALGSAITLAN
jgi:predicted RNase H-like nuclease (RuvC/YqgF family)